MSAVRREEQRETQNSTVCKTKRIEKWCVCTNRTVCGYQQMNYKYKAFSYV